MKLSSFFKNRNSIKSKLLLYMTSFCLIIFVLMWLFQIAFLNLFYKSSRKSVLETSTKEVEKSYLSHDLLSLDHISRDNSICIKILNNNKIIYDSSSFNKGCLPYKNKNELYSFINQSSDTIIVKNPKFNNEVMLMKKEISKDVLIITSTSLNPIDSIVLVLKNQFILVTLVVIVISYFIANYISKKISKPIELINNKAIEISKGNYDNKVQIDLNVLELRQLVDNLNIASEELSRTEKLQKELLSNVSHELKTPLTMIKAYAEMVRDVTYKNNTKRTDNLNIIINESDRLNLLVNDILNLTIIQSDNCIFKYEDFDITKLMNEIINLYSNLDDIIIEFNYKEKLFCNADKARIKQVILNLINNAISHSKSGSKIKIDIYIIDNDHARININNPTYIKKEQIHLIWKKYYKIDKTFTREKQATGIGLSIVQSILKKHNFNYGVNSSKKNGTDFYFDIKILDFSQNKHNNDI